MRAQARPRLPQLDARLSKVLSLVPGCSLAADIGADHGRLSLHLLRQGICERMIVSDISAASLQKARKLLAFHGFDDRADFVVADGFEAVTQPVQAVIVTGLGGESICRMLKKAGRLGEARLLLSPQTQTALLRGALGESGYRIEAEHLVTAAGRWYTILQAVPGQQALSDRERYLGYALKGSADAKVSDYLTWRLDVLSAARDADPQHKQWLEEAIRHETGE